MKPDDEIIRIPDGVPRIVSDETFARVQQMFEKRKHLGRTPKREYLLTGKLICGKCGSSMVGRSTSTRGYEYRYYDCGARARNQTCHAHSVRADNIEKLVVEAIYNEIVSPNAMPVFADRLIAYIESEKKEIPAQLDGYKRRLKETEKAIDGIIQAVTSGLYSPTMNRKMEELEADRERYLSLIRDVEFRSAAMTADKASIIKYLSTFGDIRHADPHEQRKAIDIFIDKIVITDGKADIRILSPDGQAGISQLNVTGLPAPSLCENVMIITLDLRKNTRR